jgi:hypothetical protein
MDADEPAPTVERALLRTARKGDRLFFTNWLIPIVLQVEDAPERIRGVSSIGVVLLSAPKGLFSSPYASPNGKPRVISKLKFNWAWERADIVRAAPLGEEEGEE